MRSFLCSCLCVWATALMAPVDNSTLLRDLNSQNIEFSMPCKASFLSVKRRMPQAHAQEEIVYIELRKGGARLSMASNAPGFAPSNETPNFCATLQADWDKLTIDTVFDRLQDYLADQAEDVDRATYALTVHMNRLKTPVPLVSHRVQHISFRDKGAPIDLHHMFCTMDFPNLIGLSLLIHGVSFPSGLQVPAQTVIKGYFLSVPRQCQEVEPLLHLMYAGEDFGWADQEASKGLGVAYFREGQNPLNIQDIQPWGMVAETVEESLSKESPSSHKGDVKGSLASDRIMDVRPEIQDLGEWIEILVRDLDVYHRSGHTLPGVVHKRLECALEKRLAGVDQGQHSKALSALVDIVPTLVHVITLPEADVGDEEAGTLQVKTDSRNVFMGCPPEMWLEIFGFMAPLDQARTLMGLPFLRDHLVLFCRTFPKLNQGLFPLMALAFGSESIITKIGDDFINVLDVSPLGLDCANAFDVPSGVENFSFFQEGIVFNLPKMTLHQVTPGVTKSVIVSGQIHSEPCVREGEQPGDRPDIVSIFLTLTHDAVDDGGQDPSKRKVKKTVFGPLELVGPSLCTQQLYSAKTNYMQAARHILPFLALMELESHAKQEWEERLKSAEENGSTEKS
jgi:uncharacterized glyoxalase superfamily protein PhnB